jgi:hypothetical protein
VCHLEVQNIQQENGGEGTKVDGQDSPLLWSCLVLHV